MEAVTKKRRAMDSLNSLEKMNVVIEQLKAQRKQLEAELKELQKELFNSRESMKRKL